MSRSMMMTTVTLAGSFCSEPRLKAIAYPDIGNIHRRKEREEAEPKQKRAAYHFGPRPQKLLTGKTLTAKTTITTRRPGSLGFRSLQIIIDAGPTGIKYEEFASKGGRINDAKWDIAHGTVVAT